MTDAMAVETASTAASSTNGRLLAHALAVQLEYIRLTTIDSRKEKGQFFTPPEVCGFMADLLPSKLPTTFRLLDPGAGTGALSAAVCDRLLNLPPPQLVQIDLFENDREVLPFLRKSMDYCSRAMRAHGHTMTYEIHGEDFILDAAPTIRIFPWRAASAPASIPGRHS